MTSLEASWVALTPPTPVIETMKRKRADEEARTTPLGRALEHEGSADAMFRSFVERASAAKAQVRRELPTTEEDMDGVFEDVGDIATSDATDPSIPARWTETVEQLLERPEEEAVPLTQRKASQPAPPDSDADGETMAFYSKDLVARLRAARPDTVVDASSWESVVPPPSQSTQRREAKKLVPNMASVAVAEAPPSERSEDGLTPSGELDRMLSDMAVLLRYGHEAQVQRSLETLRAKYPQDLILTRRFAEFYVANARPDLAIEQLFTLASGLFERRNVEGMRQALEQVLSIDPANERARRLVTLLEQRPVGDAGRKPTR